MRILSLILIALCLPYYISAQEEYGTIIDEDGYTNVRSDTSINSAIKGKLIQNDIFWISEEKRSGDWQKVYFLNPAKFEENTNHTRNELDQRVESEGYVHISRIAQLDTEEVPLKKVMIRNEIVYYNDSIEIKIGVKEFRKEDHEIQISKKYPIANRIDNESVWGTDGEIPTREFAFIYVKLNDVEIEFPKEQLLGLYQPNIDSAVFEFEKITNSYILSMYNSDGAGYYEAKWQIKDNLIINRYAFFPY